MNVLQQIFRDNYEIIQYSLHPRDVVMESIDKMIRCHHRHCIFTIDEQLRHFFLEDRSLLAGLSGIVRQHGFATVQDFYTAFYTAKRATDAYQI